MFCVGLCVSPALTTAQEHPRPPVEHSDVWSEPNPGIRYLVRTTTLPSTIHALVIDLAHPGVHIRATPYAERWSTVSEYATHNHLAAAINGGFWGMMQHAEGVTAGGGARWPDGSDDTEIGFFAVTRSGSAWISAPELDDDAVPAARVGEAVSGQPLLVRGGRVDVTSLDAFDSANLRHPRSSVGVSRNGKKVVLIVVDGRQGHSHGMTLYELARMFVELGADRALNLDGGGSSAMFVAEAGGIVNSPSGGRWEAKLGLGASESRDPRANRRGEGRGKQHASKVRQRDDGLEEVFVRGNEREVMNHLGVVAPAPGVAVAEIHQGTEPAPGTQVVVVERPRPPAVRLGRAREYLYPAAFALMIAAPMISLALFWRWRKRRKARRALRTA
jgi:Phosphodiester glycosidase